MWFLKQTALAAGIGSAVLVPMVFAQETDNNVATGSQSALSFQLGVETGRNLDLQDGADDQDTELNSGVSYDYTRITRLSSFRLGTVLRWVIDDDGDDLFLPSGGIGYSYLGSRSRFNFNLRHTRTKVTDQSVYLDDTTGAVLDYDGVGQRGLTQLEFNAESGLDEPIGYKFDYRLEDLKYHDSPSRSDEESRHEFYDIGLRLTPNKVMRHQLTLHRDIYKVEDSVDTRRATNRITWETERQINAVLTLVGAISYSQIDTERTVGDDSKDGFGFNLNVIREDSLGQYRLGLQNIATSTGQRTQVSMQRAREMVDGQITYMVGLSESDLGGMNWIGSARLNKELRRDDLSLNFQRRIYNSTDDNEITVTRLEAGVSHDLSEITGLNFSLIGTLTNESDGPDETRVDAEMAWERALPRQAKLEAGLRARLADDNIGEDARSHSLFVTLSRDLDFLH
ncbi:hypothetical protein BFP70_05075 [Thioclava sp. SK-1]|uniref:hypothetical protein n=1 Tax=Thioclava sp. SK-1 TaxID=1889770 RepID=UPI000826FB0E|nr:hypothetical protein [Thioclava sp. SK-1]OCX66398.1 hypothetical protein BFP70_05075 [Thioclava sp. SK-1]